MLVYNDKTELDNKQWQDWAWLETMRRQRGVKYNDNVLGNMQLQDWAWSE